MVFYEDEWANTASNIYPTEARGTAQLAEDAVYASMLYNLSKLRPSAAGGVALYKKEAYAKMQNAKIRIANMKVAEMTNIFRNKAKWIKH